MSQLTCSAFTSHLPHRTLMSSALKGEGDLEPSCSSGDLDKRSHLQRRQQGAGQTEGRREVEKMHCGPPPASGIAGSPP